MKTYYLYILASRTGTLYTGITSNLKQRIYEHKTERIPGFTSRYKVNRLLYVESFSTPKAAIQREKQVKSWRREKKVQLIDSTNPKWNDLSKDWYSESAPSGS